MSAPTVYTGLSTFRKMRFVSDRSGDFYGSNGIDNPIRYRLGATAADLAGIDAPQTAPAIASPVGGSVSAGDYHCYYRYVESREERFAELFSNLSPVTTHTAVANDQISWGIATDLEAPSQSRVTHIELLRNTVDQSIVEYRSARIGVGGTITEIATDGDTYVCTTSAKHHLIPGARIKITARSGSFTGNSNTDFAVNAYVLVTSVTDYTFVVAEADTAGGNASGGMSGGTATWKTTGYIETAGGVGGDTASDATLSSEAHDWFLELPITDELDLPFANRHTTPPDFMSVVVMFNNRAHWIAPVRYTQGTVTLTAGDATVTGSGTSWTAAMVGRLLYAKGATRPYRIDSFTSATEIELTEKAVESISAGATYVIAPDPEEFNMVYPSETDLSESVPLSNGLPLTQLTKDHDDIVGGFELGSVLYVTKSRHIYRFWYEQQDVLSAKSTLVATRGAFNQSCHDQFEGVVYLMDQMGAWRFTGGEPDPISPPIQDLFRESVSGATVDFDRAHHFHVAVEPNQQCVYFFVHFVGDTNTYPRRYAKYNLRSGAWYTGSTKHGIAAGCWAEIDGRIRLIVGSEDEHVYVANEGTTDHIATAVRAAATAGAASTVTIAQAGISANAWQRATVAIYHKTTGNREWRKVSSNTATSGGSVTITADAAWDEAIVAGDIVTVGGILATATSKSYDFVAGDQGEHENQRGVQIYFQPTTAAAELGLRQLLDYDTTGEEFVYHTDWAGALKAIEGTAWLEARMISALDTEYTSRGFVEWTWDAHLATRGSGHRTMQIQVYAIQGADAIIVDELIVKGVV